MNFIKRLAERIGDFFKRKKTEKTRNENPCDNLSRHSERILGRTIQTQDILHEETKYQKYLVWRGIINAPSIHTTCKSTRCSSM